MPLNTLTAGVARVDITPDRSLELSGVPRRRSAGVLDRIEAQTLVLRDAAGQSAVLASLDTLYVPRDWGEEVRRRIAKTVGIDDSKALDSVMLAASHTHAAPGLQTLRQWGTADMRYREEAAERLVQCASAAASDMRPAGVRVGTAELPSASCNRRTPSGPVDPTVTVIGVVDAVQNPLAILVNFACHPVTLWGYQDLISPDFPGYLRQGLMEHFGPGTTPMYLNGAAGNLNPADFDREHVNVDYSKRMATRIVRASLQAWRDSKEMDPQPLKTGLAHRSILLDPFPSSDHIDAMIQRERQYVLEHPEQELAEDRLLRTIQWASDVRQARQDPDLPECDELELQAIRLGDLLLLAVPGELYVEIGRRIQGMSPFRHTVIAGYANGMLGYLCTRAWQEQAGAQEKFISLRLRSLSAETEDVLYQTATDLFTQV